MPEDCIFHCRTKRLSSSSSLRSWAKIWLLALQHPRTDMAPITFEASLPHPDDTDKLGARLADAVSNEAACVTDHGLAIRLQGNLGAGKTSLVRAMLRRFGFAGAVKSPTFSLVETYPIGALTLNHFDFYRFEEPEEFEDAGFRDLFGPGFICATEWTEKAAPYVPEADLIVELELEGLGRHAVLKACTPLGESIVSRVLETSK
jgi:tRNA threonylcarbamoyladenosine biosynthesis protein TsaE